MALFYLIIFTYYIYIYNAKWFREFDYDDDDEVVENDDNQKKNYNYYWTLQL